MNRPSFRRHRNGLVQSRGSLAVGIVVLLMILLAAVRFAAPTFWYQMATPVWRVGSSLSARVAGTGASKSELIVERDTSERKAAALAAQNAALSARVADLTKLLGSRTEATPAVVASVVARPPVAPYDILIIDQGTTAGIKLGDLVTGNGGTPVGTIGEADPAQSRVTLFSTHGIQTSGWAGDARISVTLTGEGAGAFSATVPKSAGIKTGDEVYMARAGAFPVGTVVKIESDPSSPSVDLDVRPYSNPFSLVWVSVEKR